MGPVIVGVLFFILVGVLEYKKAQKAKNKGVPSSDGENFPFPSFDVDSDEQQSEEDEWLGRTVEPQRKPVDIKQVKLMAEYAAVGTIPNEKVVPKQEYEDFEFDAEKAVIYAEIMAPKYKDEE